MENNMENILWKDCKWPLGILTINSLYRGKISNTEQDSGTANFSIDCDDSPT